MIKYTCVECGFAGLFEDFQHGDCPACGSQDVHCFEDNSEYELLPVYDLDVCLDLGECSFDLGEF